jgi:hypothetical protein
MDDFCEKIGLSNSTLYFAPANNDDSPLLKQENKLYLYQLIHVLKKHTTFGHSWKSLTHCRKVRVVNGIPAGSVAKVPDKPKRKIIPTNYGKNTETLNSKEQQRNIRKWIASRYDFVNYMKVLFSECLVPKLILFFQVECHAKLNLG